MKTLKQVSIEYLEYLKTQGKSERTIYTYGKDLEQIIAFFGEEKEINKNLIPHVGKFLKSDELLKKASKVPSSGDLGVLMIDRAKPTIDKTIRVFRMFMEWAKEKEYIESVPLVKEMKRKSDK